MKGDWTVVPSVNVQCRRRLSLHFPIAPLTRRLVMQDHHAVVETNVSVASHVLLDNLCWGSIAGEAHAVSPANRYAKDLPGSNTRRCETIPRKRRWSKSVGPGHISTVRSYSGVDVRSSLAPLQSHRWSQQGSQGLEIDSFRFLKHCPILEVIRS